MPPPAGGTSAVIPLFGFPGWRYRNLNEVLLYPNTFDEDYQVKAAQRDNHRHGGKRGDEPHDDPLLPALRDSFAHPSGGRM